MLCCFLAVLIAFVTDDVFSHDVEPLMMLQNRRHYESIHDKKPDPVEGNEKKRHRHWSVTAAVQDSVEAIADVSRDATVDVAAKLEEVISSPSESLSSEVPEGVLTDAESVADEAKNQTLEQSLITIGTSMAKVIWKRAIVVNQGKANEYCDDSYSIENSVERYCGEDPFKGCWSECISDKDSVNEQMFQDWDNFNKAHGGTIVKFPSRDQDGVNQIELGGWWLPASTNDTSGGPRISLTDTSQRPRIVIQHGYMSCSNSPRIMYAAYQLRKMGFDVLMTNLRDHCLSDDDNGLNEWGHSGPYDLLGAWDFALSHNRSSTDPIPESKVGIMGFSMGGFMAATACLLEDSVPGCWMDSPTISPRDAMLDGIEKNVLKELDQVTATHFWGTIVNMGAEEGVYLNANFPKLMLKQRNTEHPRDLFWAHNPDDMMVSYESAESLMDSFANSGSFNVEHMQGTKTCACEPDGKYCHMNDHYYFNRASKYEQELCKYWSKVFKLPNTDNC